MADSMCGPSNALQNFQKQSQGDRTLQQDRLSARTPQSQGFRTAGPSAHNLDPEFEAFQAGQLPLQHPEAGFHPGFQRAHTPQPQQQRMNAGPGASWANDFQRLAIASPGMQQQGLPQAQHAGGWHQEFAQMNNTQAGMPQQQQQHSYNAPLERLSSLATTPFGMGQQPMYQTPMYQPPQQMQPEQPQQQLGAEVGTFDEAAFAAAFDQAAQSELQSEQASLSHALQEDHLTPAPIGADAIHHPDAPSQQLLTPAQESDDLARTAGALLTSVQGDQSDKFANSQFLQLMRQLRDKEVVVEGDAILPAGSAGQGGGGAENRVNADVISDPDPDALTAPRQSQGGGRGGGGTPWLGPDWPVTPYRSAGGSPTLEYRRANGRRGSGTAFPLPTEGEVEANFKGMREERWTDGENTMMNYKRANGDFEPRPLPPTPLVPRAMGGGNRGARGLRTEADREQADREQADRGLGPEERAAKLAQEEGWAGVRERLRGLRERMVVEEGRLREVAEEAVREELAREGRSWGDS